MAGVSHINLAPGKCTLPLQDAVDLMKTWKVRTRWSGRWGALLQRGTAVASASRAACASLTTARAAPAPPQEEIGDDPAKFAERAKSDSHCPTGPNGGSLGFVVRAKLCEQFDEVVFNEEPGAVYGPVTTPAGLHLIFVHSCRDPTKKA